MKKLFLTASLTFAVVAPATAQASTNTTRQHTTVVRTISLWQQWDKRWNVKWNKRWDVRFNRKWRREHPPAPPPSSANFTGGSLADVPGVPASFAACVAFRESTDGQLSPNIYGLESYYAGESLAQQKEVMSQMYASRGVEPWQPYDGC